MKKSRFTEQQIAFALQQAEAGTSVDEVCRKMGICQAPFAMLSPSRCLRLACGALDGLGAPRPPLAP
jgi:Transposase